MWESYFTQILKDAFEAAQEKEKVSLRGFAKRLGLSASVLSEILRDKRALVAPRALAVAEMAGVPASSLKRLRMMVESLENDDSGRTLAHGDVVDLIMNPVYYALLSALEVLPVPSSIDDLAKFLKLEPAQADVIVSKLAAFGVVEREDENVYWWGKHLTTTHDIPNEKLRSFHRASLEETITALDTIPVDEREVTAITFAASESRLPLAKAEIRKFRDVLATNMHGKKADRVYRLSIQLIPVSARLNGQPEKGEES